jgi:hypothetical protein
MAVWRENRLPELAAIADDHRMRAFCPEAAA